MDRGAVVMVSLDELDKIVRAAVRDEIQAMSVQPQLRKPAKRRPRVEVETKPSPATVEKVRRKLRRAGVKA